MIRTCLMIAAIVAAAPSYASPDDARLNAVYARLAAARAAGDLATMVAAFPTEALLIDQRPNPALGGGAALEAQIKSLAENVVAKKLTIDTRYRIERRSIIDDVAIDAGYMRMTMTRPDGTAGTRFARFMVTMKKMKSGDWKIIGDASMPSTEAAWTTVPRTAGLHYDS